MELMQYFQIVRRWAWLLILGLVVGALGGFLISRYQTPIYQSSVRLMISPAPDQSTSGYNDYYSSQQALQTYTQIINTQPIIDAISIKLGYGVGSGQISVSPVRDSQLLRITVSDNDPQRAADIANAIHGVLVAQNEQMQNSRYAESEQSLQTQLKQVENQINALQQNIDQASEKTLNDQRSQVENQLKDLQDQVLKVQKEISDLTPVADSRLGPTPTPSVEQSDLLRQKQLELNQLQTNLTYYQQIYLNLNQPSQNNSGDDSRVVQMRSTLALYQQIYSNLLASYENIRLSRLRNTTNIVQVESAYPSNSPVRPRPLTNTGLGAVIGLMLAAGIIFLVEYLDDTIKTPDDVQRLVGLPVIGYIAEMEVQSPDDLVYVSEEPRSPVSEAFRSLRTNVEFAGAANPIHSILVTSSTPGEGKTTIAVNLAMVFAQAGRHTILLDADMRRPRVHRHLGLSNRVGLSDIFLNRSSLDDVIRPWKETEMSVITSGSLPPSPAELLGSDVMTNTLSQLHSFSQMVVIDSPPGLVTDSSILAAKVDAALIVVQPGQTHAGSLQALTEQLQRSGGRLIGVVFNRIPRSRAYYYGGYRYNAGYYYNGYRNSYGDYYYYYGDGHKKRSNGKGEHATQKFQISNIGNNAASTFLRFFRKGGRVEEGASRKKKD